MDLEKIIVRIKSEFPKSAIDLVESIELVKFTVNDIMSAINNKMNEAFSLKDFDSVSEYSQLGKEIYKYEEQIDRLLELLDIESYSNEPEVINAEKVILNDSDYEVDPKVEHTLYEDFTHIRPFAFRLKGREMILVRNWKEMFFETSKLLFEMNEEKFTEFIYNPKMNGKKRRYFATESNGMSEPMLIHNRLFIESHMNANGFRFLILKMLQEYGLKVTDYKVFFKADYSEKHNN